MAIGWRSAALAMTGSVSFVRPQFAGPAHLWCEMMS